VFLIKDKNREQLNELKKIQ